MYRIYFNESTKWKQNNNYINQTKCTLRHNELYCLGALISSKKKLKPFLVTYQKKKLERKKKQETRVSVEFNQIILSHFHSSIIVAL